MRGARPASGRRRFPLWVLLAAVLVVALAAGSGLFSSSPPTKAQRAAAIESVLRCPSCEDLSVADSTAPTAVAVRSTVRQLLDRGWSDARIESYLVARYGDSIALDPPARGWTALVWVLPLAAGAAAAVAVSVVLVRRRRADSGRSGEVAGGPEELEERKRFLTRSLADADAEYLAGDLADRDYLALRRRDLARLAQVEARLSPRALLGAPPTPADGSAVPGDAPSEVPPSGSGPDRDEAEAGGDRTRRSGPRWLLRGAVGAFAAALIVAVSLFASNRLPGQTATGSVSLTQSQRIAEQLDRAASLENSGQLGQAATIYQSVLSAHPGNEVALAQLGWVEYQVGRAGHSASLMHDAEVKVERATTLEPGDYAASLYLGTILLQQDGNAAGAVGQFQRFLADGPPAALVRQAAPELRQAYTQAGVALPPQLAGG